jgi:hypothetical protein
VELTGIPARNRFTSLPGAAQLARNWIVSSDQMILGATPAGEAHCQGTYAFVMVWVIATLTLDFGSGPILYSMV